METLANYQIDLLEPLEYDSPSQGESPMAPPGKTGIDWKAIFAGLVFGGGLVWAAHYEIVKLDEKIAGIDGHLTKVETAVRIIGAKQGGDTKALIDEALAVAKNASDSGRTEGAKTVLHIANRLLAERIASREPAAQDFFDGAVQKYRSIKKSPELSDALWDGTTKLAEYRSSITPVPAGIQVHIGQLIQRGGFRYLKDSLISGPNAVVFGSEHGFVLDGFWLDNVVLENTTIIYHGGPVILQNVNFINCLFEVRKLPQSEQLLEAATNQPANATIG